MKQQTLAMAADQGAGFEQYRRPTKRGLFLETMEQIVPWTQLCEVVEPYYPKGVGGRPPVSLERMLRMYFVQHWFNLADVTCEEALLDSTALGRWDRFREGARSGWQHAVEVSPLPEHNKLGEQLFAKVGAILQGCGLKIGTGIIVGPLSARRVRRRTKTRRETSRCIRHEKEGMGSSSPVILSVCLRATM